MSSKGTAVKDKWKMKKWFTLIAPKMFGEVPLGSTPASDSGYVPKRKVETTLYDLTGDFSLVHIHVYFQAATVNGDKVFTRFYGHELSRDYTRSLIRRKSSKINAIVDVTTKDGYQMRIKSLALTTYKCHRSQMSEIRKIMADLIVKEASEMTFDDLVQAVVFGKMSNDLFEASKKIYPLRKVEIEKTKLLKVPEKQPLLNESVTPSSG
ncbi:30S ribosomal protein S3ae [Sulfuracidifex metallicus]|jgi:small subunit ribosomal protein S3Ae|uniref:Small ribosomal subunit protein eS1 n=1 Tax=Sulfuracidifex metallicus DSM 6482 = JCM 9184 TaxID=523847 RepID=A0A6A9QIU1_SULME|nr:30S ribosomal protein S3ae [Sulfuracidifex metallicus]MCY0849186.1 30S ribosomal protein S3ae [Sulfuracidifex metallicus]MUN28584.1 30S ribosomal protein S3ae [Sulfuracidifex metallicus DSM 6482 = JCM 9184]WOE50883.1 30S ribosomal protein S3ae [Sulfuracidifex metallicus DSM 6482 = JCM 9184]